MDATDGMGSVHGRSTASATGSSMRLAIVNWPAAICDGRIPEKRRP